MGQAAYWVGLDERLAGWLAKALKRRPAAEGRGAGAIRAAAPLSRRVRRELADAGERLIARGSFDRPLYAATIGALAEVEHPRAAGLVAAALKRNCGGGLTTLAAAGRCCEPSLRAQLARLAASPHPDLAFGAGLVCELRAAWGAEHLASAAARINESARIALCTDLVAPLLAPRPEPCPMSQTVGPAMGVLRRAERHLGRWLVFALAAVRGGDPSPLSEADERASRGSSSARAAWTLLGWALQPGSAVPTVRPTVEVIARLSERPTADRDMGFLFRLSRHRADAAKSTLEALCREPLRAPVAVRAAGVLAGVYHDTAALDAVRRVADGRPSKRLQGIAVAALWDAGLHREARQRAAALRGARSLTCSVWGGLVLRGARGTPVISEARFRMLEQGWVH